MKLRALLLGVALAAAATGATGDQADTARAVAECLGCHDYGADAPVHQVLLGSHGIEGDPADMAGRSGCADCHGSSEAHRQAPREHAPSVSFGPRWTASAAQQDARCLACHEADIAANWRHALHMVNDLTCVTCHDIHAAEDRVLFDDQQREVCTTCHKAQRSGIHGLGSDAAEQPPCSLCHNPHDHEGADSRMLQNQSAGCVFCHDADQMAVLAAGNPAAGNYHRVMASPERSCIDCHRGISHAPEDSAPPLHPQAVHSRTVTLFAPGGIDREWLLHEHPGSQPLRQGMHCRRCHRGDEAAMGASLAPNRTPSSREVGLAFALESERLVLDLNWAGDPGDRQVALMWADAYAGEGRQGACFMACHRAEGHESLGSPAVRPGAMGGAAFAGQLAHLWRIPLVNGNGAGEDRADAALPEGLSVSRALEDGQWRVTLRIPIVEQASPGAISPQGRYLLGIALHGADHPGAGHWVSLPLSVGFAGDDTDFIAQ